MINVMSIIKLSSHSVVFKKTFVSFIQKKSSVNQSKNIPIYDSSTDY